MKRCVIKYVISLKWCWWWFQQNILHCIKVLFVFFVDCECCTNSIYILQNNKCTLHIIDTNNLKQTPKTKECTLNSKELNDDTICVAHVYLTINDFGWGENFVNLFVIWVFRFVFGMHSNCWLKHPISIIIIIISAWLNWNSSGSHRIIHCSLASASALYVYIKFDYVWWIIHFQNDRIAHWNRFK